MSKKQPKTYRYSYFCRDCRQEAKADKIANLCSSCGGVKLTISDHKTLKTITKGME